MRCTVIRIYVVILEEINIIRSVLSSAFRFRQYYSTQVPEPTVYNYRETWELETPKGLWKLSWILMWSYFSGPYLCTEYA